jgi:hypothetical protein
MSDVCKNGSLHLSPSLKSARCPVREAVHLCLCRSYTRLPAPVLTFAVFENERDHCGEAVPTLARLRTPTPVGLSPIG